MMTNERNEGGYSGLPLVAIVGRPNVGKSTLFNRLAGYRKSIILDQPGLTRDRIFERVEWLGREFLAVDTGGFDPGAGDNMGVAIREQATIAIEEADVIIFMVDVRDGLTAADHEIRDILRRTRKPVILGVNKCDNVNEYNEAFTFAELGIEDLFPISSVRGHGVGELLDMVLDRLPDDAPEVGGEESGEHIPRIAIVGRQNVGKSTLVNTILGENRMIASDIPGTTRDAVDSHVQIEGKAYVIIDTAGIRRRGRIDIGAEKLSVLRAVRGMERADLAVILIDGAEGLTEQDAHIIGLAVESGCAGILAVNKWDLVDKDTNTAGSWAKALRDELGFFSYAPILFLSALTGQRVRRVFEMAETILPEYFKEIETAELNRWLRMAIGKNPPPTRKRRTLKVNYITQIKSGPPTFALFVNDPNLMHFSYERYLSNQLRKSFGFEGTPIQLRLRKKSKDRNE